jgi:hypothetical protein
LEELPILVTFILKIRDAFTPQRGVVRELFDQ